MSQEKYFNFCKSLTHFGALISDENFGQVPIHLNRDNSRKNKPQVFCQKKFTVLHLIEAVVNMAMSTSNIELSSEFHNKKGYRNAFQEKCIVYIYTKYYIGKGEVCHETLSR